MGFSSEYVIKALTRRGVNDVSKVILVTAMPKDEFSRRRNEDAMGAILKYLDIVGIRDVKVISVNVDVPFDSVLLQISSMGGFDGYVEFYLIGGMRILLLALYYLALILSKIRRVRVYAFDENMQNFYELPVSIPRIPTQEQLKLLELLTTKLSLSDITRIMDKSESTIVSQLNALGELVSCERIGRRTKLCETTIMGKVILNLMR
ncbi:CRISPR-associated transcriptional regulator Csa3 [Vulcanisaeta sp. JCM 14467]